MSAENGARVRGAKNGGGEGWSIIGECTAPCPVFSERPANATHITRIDAVDEVGACWIVFIVSLAVAFRSSGLNLLDISDSKARFLFRIFRSLQDFFFFFKHRF